MTPKKTTTITLELTRDELSALENALIARQTTAIASNAAGHAATIKRIRNAIEGQVTR
jgi:hypothetical protein